MDYVSGFKFTLLFHGWMLKPDMKTRVCVCVCLIKHRNLSQYLTNTILSSTDTVITSWYLPFSLIPIWLCFFLPLFLPVLHAPLCSDYWLCVCVCVYLEIKQVGHFFGGGERITDGPCQISVHLALFLSSFPHTHLRIYTACLPSVCKDICTYTLVHISDIYGLG